MPETRDTELRNIVSVSWGDHLVFGESDGLLDTPDSLRRRMEVWRDDLKAGTLHWRQQRTRKNGRFQAAPEYEAAAREERLQDIRWDDFDVVPRAAHELGMKAYMYVSVFDEGWPLPSDAEREVSYHNVGHGQHVSSQSNFTIEHPEYVVVDRSGQRRQWGVLCPAYQEVREHLCQRFTGLMDGYDFDGLFVCLRTQSRPADYADQYGFNEPVREEYLRLYGRDIRAQDFDIQLWRDLQGTYLTRLLAELGQAMKESGRGLGVGCARGDVIGPPIGNATLQWREWVARGLLDDLVINQGSSQCPSLWIQLWPMHRGYGYVQSYLDGHNMPALGEQLTDDYGPALEGKSTGLYVARQWSERSVEEEEALLTHPAVSGLVFSSFRFDNAERILGHSGDWRI